MSTIKISKRQWEFIGKQAGWMKKSQDDNDTPNTAEIIASIKDGSNTYFGYSHFDESNMADYTLMSTTIRDLRDVYGISEEDAADIVQSLTHAGE